jgi:predicted metal-binding protein
LEVKVEHREELEALFEQHGCADFKWIDPKEIVVAQWVRMKCKFGCDDYGRNASCPPNTLPIAECRQFFNEYRTAALFRFEKKVDEPKDRHPWTNEVHQQLSVLEREVFLQGNEKAFLLFIGNCRLCSKCPSVREECKHPDLSRPSLEAMGVDVFTTVRQQGYPIKVLADYEEAMNRYALLLVE